MSTAADRKKARELYMATLNQQREEEKATAKPTPPPAAPVTYSSREEKMNAREKMLEEKRLKFLQKSGKLPSTDSGGSTNIPATNNPPQMQPSQQQQLQQPPSQLQQQSRQPVERTSHPESLQAGKHGDDGANTLAERYGKKDDPVYRPKPKVNIQAHPPSSEDPFKTQNLNPSDITPPQRDPFAHTINPQAMQAVNDRGGGLEQIGQGVNPANEKEAKRLKQAEYARQLQQDNGSMPVPQQQHRQAPGDNGVGGLGNIGQANPLNDKEAKRNKQAEYARQLQQDNGSLPVSQQHNHQQHRQAPSDNGVGGLSNIGAAPSDKDAKRNKQAEYARQLQQDNGSIPVSQQQHPQQHRQQQPSHDADNGTGLGNIGQSNIPNTKEMKRAKQNEYARQLQQDNQSNMIPSKPYQPSAQGDNNGGGLFGGGDHNTEDAKAIKKAKQMEYNRQLQQDNPHMYQKNHHPQHQQNNYNNNNNQGGPGGYNLVTGANQGGGDGSHNDPHNDAKAMKRAKQMEYNRQLQEHEELKRQQDFVQNNQQHAQLRNYHNHNSPTRQNSMHNNQSQQTGSNGSLPDAGWEIGPLGQPVRKTLAVGNRGAQKAYVAKKHSPRKPDNFGQQPNFHQNYNFNDNQGGYDPQNYGQNQNGFQQNNNMGNRQQQYNNFQGNNQYNQPYNQNNGFNNNNNNHGGPDMFSGQYNNNNNGGGGGLDMFGNNNQRNRGNNDNSSQAEYARAIEEQIRLKKEGTAALKKAEAEEEARLYQKLEREREEMQKAFEEENKQKKIKEENERVASLELQIQQKKQQKIDEEDRLKEIERKEDERVAREQAALTAQLEEELRRDKKLDTAAAQQNNAFDEHPVGGNSGNNGNKNNLFRAPSPILDPHQRNPNMFKAPTSPIETENNNHFQPPSSPALPAQRKNKIFRAESPVLEPNPPISSRNNHHLFASSPPQSPKHQQQHSGDEQHTHSSRSGSRQSSHHSNRNNKKPQSPFRKQAEPPQKIELDANHPIILDLKKETADARDEANRARKELEQLRQLVSQDRKRNHANNNKPMPTQQPHVQSEVPSLTIPTSPHKSHKNQDNDEQRLDSARTFIRKYQRSYNADRPPEHPLRETKRTNMTHNSLEQSMQSESILHRPDITGSELPADFHALMDLDKTLKSESRFVYPDGRSFVAGGNSNTKEASVDEDRPNSSTPRQYHLQPYENASILPIKMPLPSPPQKSPTRQPRKYELEIDDTVLSGINVEASISTLGSGPLSPAGSAMTLASERSKRRNGSSQSHTRDQNSTNSKSKANDHDDDDDDDGLNFDIDKAFRRNRRKYELLEKMGVRNEITENNQHNEYNVFSGPEELDLLLNGLKSVNSSRPTTAGTGINSSRPTTGGTLQGESQLLNNRDYSSLLQQEREKHKQKQQSHYQKHGYSRRQHHHDRPQPQNISHDRHETLHKQASRPNSSSSAFSRSSSPLTSPRSPTRAHSQGSKIRKSNKLQASGRRALGNAMVHPEMKTKDDDDDDGESYSSQLASTRDRGQYNAMAARRNSHIQDQIASAYSQENLLQKQQDGNRDKSHGGHKQKQQRHMMGDDEDEDVGVQRQPYSSISVEQVQDIDYSEYGF